MKLLERLIHNATQDKLAHFYLIETSTHEEASHEALIHFIHQFIQNYYLKVESNTKIYENLAELNKLIDHPDIFILGDLVKDQDEKSPGSFKVEQANALNRFFEFRPILSRKKFAIITEAHRISNIVSNKWLKLLEEPPQDGTIFILNPKRIKLLETIHSRALHLRLSGHSSLADFSQWKDFLDQLSKLSFSEFLESSKQDNFPKKIQELINWESKQDLGFKSKEKLIVFLKYLEELETFHQASTTKWALFYSHLKDNVLVQGDR